MLLLAAIVTRLYDRTFGGLIARLRADRQQGQLGQTLIEYAFLLAWGALLILVAVTTLGKNLLQTFNATAGRI